VTTMVANEYLEGSAHCWPDPELYRCVGTLICHQTVCADSANTTPSLNIYPDSITISFGQICQCLNLCQKHPRIGKTQLLLLHHTLADRLTYQTHIPGIWKQPFEVEFRVILAMIIPEPKKALAGNHRPQEHPITASHVPESSRQPRPAFIIQEDQSEISQNQATIIIYVYVFRFSYLCGIGFVCAARLRPQPRAERPGEHQVVTFEERGIVHSESLG